MSSQTKHLRVQPVCRSFSIEWEVQNCVFDRRLPLSPLLIAHKDRFLYKWSHNSLLFQSYSRSVLLVTGPALKGCAVGAGNTRIPILSRPSPPPSTALLHWVGIQRYMHTPKMGKLPISPLFLFSHCSLCECWMHLGRYDTLFPWCWTWTWPWPWQGQRGAYVGLNYLCGPDLGHLIQAFGDNNSTLCFSFFAFFFSFLIEVLYPA